VAAPLRLHRSRPGRHPLLPRPLLLLLPRPLLLLLLLLLWTGRQRPPKRPRLRRRLCL
jgi:hypothetical protein